MRWGRKFITLRSSQTIILIPFSRVLPTRFPHAVSSSPLSQWHSPTDLFHSRISRRRNSFNNTPGIGILICSLLLAGLILYMTFLSPHGILLLSSSKWPILTNHTSSLPTSDVLSLEQIKDIVATTRGFFSRDYSLSLGWNNVSIRGNLIQSRTDDPKIDAIYPRSSPLPSKSP